MTGTDTIENLARLAGTMLLVASLKLGRGSRIRARLRRAREGVRRPRRSSANARPISKRSAVAIRRRLRTIVGVLWISLLLAIVGYAAIAGDAGFAQLEEIGIPVLME